MGVHIVFLFPSNLKVQHLKVTLSPMCSALRPGRALSLICESLPKHITTLPAFFPVLRLGCHWLAGQPFAVTEMLSDRPAILKGPAEPDRGDLVCWGSPRWGSGCSPGSLKGQCCAEGCGGLAEPDHIGARARGEGRGDRGSRPHFFSVTPIKRSDRQAAVSGRTEGCGSCPRVTPTLSTARCGS